MSKNSIVYSPVTSSWSVRSLGLASKNNDNISIDGDTILTGDLRVENGNVGINVQSTPSEILHIRSNTTSTTEGIFIQDPTATLYGAEIMYDDANSRVILGSRSNDVSKQQIQIDRDNLRIGVNRTPVSGYGLAVSGSSITYGDVVVQGDLNKTSGNPAAIFNITAQAPSLSNSSWDFSYGYNITDSDAGVILPFDCELIGMSMQIVGTTTGPCIVVGYRNGSITTGVAATTLAGTNSSSYNDVTSSPYSFSAGDRFSFYTVLGDGGVENAVASAWFRTT